MHILKNCRCWLLLLPAAAHAQSGPIPDSLLTHANTVVRRHDVEVRIKNIEEIDINTTLTVTILNEKGAGYAQQVEVESSFFKIRKMEARLYDAQGSLVRESSKKDLQTQSSAAGANYEFSDTQYKLLDMTYGQYPYTVEFTINTSIKSFFQVPGIVLQRLGQSVVQSSYTLTAPADYRFKHKLLNAVGQPVVSDQNREKTWRWTFQNLPAKPDEVSHPFFRDQYAQLLIAPEQVSVDGRAGQFGNWQEVGRFFYDLNKNRDQLSPAMQATVQQLTRNAPTPQAKIAALYRYLQHNHRYISIQIGIGGWQTFDAQFVEQKKYGDCKALSNYMQALLKAAGIEAWQALIFGDADGAPACYDDTPIPAFNHVVVYVPGEDLWLECTSRDAAPGYLSDFTAGHPALLLTPAGGRLVRSPAIAAVHNTERKRFDLELDPTGSGRLRCQATLTGEQEERYRSNVKNEQPAEVEKRFVARLNYAVATIHTLKISPDSLLPTTDLRFDVQLGNYSTRSGKRMFVPIGKVDPIRPNLPADDQRMLDIQISRCYTASDTIVVRFPPGYRAENLPPAKKIDHEFGSYQLSIQPQEGGVVVIRQATLHPVQAPATRYAEIRQFYTDLSKIDAAQLVLIREER